MTSTAPARTGLHRVPIPADVAPSGIAAAVRRLAHRPRLVAFGGSWSWGSLVATDPVFTAPDGADPFTVLDAPPRPVRPGAPPDAGATGAVGGGWFGLLDHAPPGERPTASLSWYRDVLRHDGGRWWFEALVVGRSPLPGLPDRPGAAHPDTRSAEDRCAELCADLARPAPQRSARIAVTRWPDRDAHLAAVERCVTEIRRGEIFQANVATRLEVRLDGDPHEAWARLVEPVAPARAALVVTPGRAAVGASPELFLHRDGDRVTTAPIKGTRPRTGGSGDEAERARLGASVKDAAENVMIVDLMRNDLARVARPGGVRPGQLLTVEPHPGVWHLVSRVHATLRDDVTDAGLLAATFPPGSVTGAPKIRACEVIADCEDGGRGLFTGAVGGVSPLAGLELNVAIRTLDLGPAGPDGSRAGRLGVGGGITVDSDPAEEFGEVLTKAAPVLAALDGPPRPLRPQVGRPADRSAGLFETLSCVDGRARRVGEHAARLRRSYLAVTGRPLGARVEAEVAAAVAGLSGQHRVRVEASPRDPSRVTVRAIPWAGPVPLVEQDGVVAVVRRGTDGESHKFADRRWLDAHEAASARSTPLLCDPTGRVLETTHSAVAAVHRGRLWVPPLDGRILPGTGRRALLDLVGPGAVRIAPLPLAALTEADGFLLVNALRGVQWVRRVDDADHTVAAWDGPDPLTRHLAEVLSR
ncbi:chorismate-binding protein [Pseudonocardia sp. ICBG1293]|uniref:chorismate-binding protein n=1 Tax=Pseudonocardia sp. ICBG1293 TaxID=2844382 RepID=UPI001CCCF980|nr:chorismate-binding protein [Pseudonocardia sp. ICBG1293]